MKTNRKTHHRGVLSDNVLSAPIAMLLALLLIAAATLDGDVPAQSKRKPTGSQGAKVKPPSAVVPDERDPYTDPEMLAQLANDKLDQLTEKEAPELMEALRKAQRINYRVNNKPGCPVTITSAGVKGIRIDYLLSSRWALTREPGGPINEPRELYLLTEDAVSLKNNTDQEITAISVVAKNQLGSLSPRFDRCPPLKAHGVTTCSEGSRHYTNLQPEDLTAEVDGVYFRDGRVWGRAFRSPPPPPPPPPPGVAPQRVFKVEKFQGPPELKVVRRSEQELRSTAIRKVEPVYPNARDLRGSATVQLIVAPTGKVSCAIFLSGPPALRRAVIEAVKQWEFKLAVGEVTVGVLSF